MAVDSSFDGGAEGWTAGKEQTNGICLEGLTCPSVTNEFHASGGIEKSGFIETKEGGLLSVGLLAESSGTWESPAFTYLGVAGQRPTKVEFTLARRAQLSNLLAMPGAQATYTVELVDKTTPAGSVVVVNSATLAGAEEWKSASTPIAPTVLEKGDSYRVRIRTSFVTPAAVVPAGGVGYDEVELTASREEAEAGPSGPEGPGGSDGSNGSKGSEGTDGKNGWNEGSTGSKGAGGSEGNGGAKSATGAAGLTSAELRGMLGSRGLAGTASLHKGKVVVTGTCPKGIRGGCTVRIKGLLNRHEAATLSGRAKIAEGGRHRFVVALAPGARGAVQRQQQLLVKERVRVGNARVTLYKRLKLVER
ncbi:MAG TPA: hypothetical protein VGH14_21870 [Solirubrobacterales bacterium]